MQFGSDTTLRLLIVDDSVEAAEAIISGLRNGGIAVRPSRPDSEDDLSEMLATQPPDLVIAARDARSVPLERVMALVDGSGKDLPVLMLVDAIDDDRARRLHAGLAARLSGYLVPKMVREIAGGSGKVPL